MNKNSCDRIEPRQVRKIRPTRRSVSGIYAFRGETRIPFESSLERDFLVRQEYFLHVLDVIPQPVQVPFKAANGQLFTYTPDFLVYYRLGNRPYLEYPKPALVEVKPEGAWRKYWRQWLPKWKSAYRYAKDQGWEFHIYDESRIRDRTFENIKFLERYKRMQFSTEESRWVIENVRQAGSVPFHYILARHFMGAYRNEGVAHIWHLLATRQLDCDISQRLGELTNLWVPTDE